MNQDVKRDESKSKKDEANRKETSRAPVPVRPSDVYESDFLLVRDDH